MLLVIVFVVQDPFLSKAGRLEGNGTPETIQAFVYDTSIQDMEGFFIRYYPNGGTVPGETLTEYSTEDLPILPDAPVRDGYNFAGWYTDSGFSNKINRIDEDAARDYNLYAKWTKCINTDQNVQMYSYQSKNKKLKDCSYTFLNHIKIPGMPSTREEDIRANRITDTSQCPQGICMTDEFLLVSAYSSGEGSYGCLHIFNRENGEYLATLGLKKKSHMGGITFDGSNIWVCHSSSRTLECIPYAFVEWVASCMPQSVIDCSSMFEEYKVSNAPSCVAYHDGLLWVATHTKILNSTMTAYQIKADGLKKVKSYRIPDKVQGVAFDRDGRVFISSSYGRTSSSYLKLYESAELLDQKPGKPMAKVEMPPCSEEICVTEDDVYILFESAGEKYLEGTDGKGRSVSPLDEVLVLSKKSVW